MSRTRTLTNLIADVRQRTNMETSTFVVDTEITEYLNQEIAELWGRLTQGADQPYYRESATISVVPGTSQYNLPSDFWNLQGVEATINNITGAILPFMPMEHAAQSMATPWGLISPVRYRMGSTATSGAPTMWIEFLPASYTFPATVYYTPTAPRLINVAGSDSFDGFNGFEMACIYGVCATIREKEETDPGFFLAQKERIYKHIDSLAGQRDMGATERVQDVRANSADRFGGWWP